ncbi:MAG TPA: hypothetical protein VJJ80_01730 [Patescibacteria group bacterium]|nr:hypothetical protein [Patescibacteria group bacterium]
MAEAESRQEQEVLDAGSLTVDDLHSFILKNNGKVKIKGTYKQINVLTVSLLFDYSMTFHVTPVGDNVFEISA